jgi:hypothetical protein
MIRQLLISSCIAVSSSVTANTWIYRPNWEACFVTCACLCALVAGIALDKE